jgi:hypothetical protein
MADDKEEPPRKTVEVGETSDPSATGATRAAAADELSAEAKDESPASLSGQSKVDDEAPASSPGTRSKAEDETLASPSGEQKIVYAKQPSRAPALIGALILGAASGFGGAFALRAYDAAQGPDINDSVAKLNARAVELERKNEASAAALAALQNRLAAAENNAGKAAASADSALAEAQKALAARPLAAAADGRHAAAPELGPIEAKVGAFEQKIKALETALATPKVDARAQQDRENADQNARALNSKGLVAASLVQHILRGESFAKEVAALENLGVDPAKLAPLQAAAKTGVASVADLADQFAAVAPSLDAPEPAKQDLGLLDRLAHDAQSLVRIHRPGDPNATDIPGRVAAIENALAHSDVAKAYAVWLQLPSDAKARSAQWGAAAKARLDALAAAGVIEADAVTALGKPKS